MSGSMSFDSYYWADVDFADQALDAARAELAEPTADQAELAAFRTLLGADSAAANGIALDQYRYAEASNRFGTDNPFESEADAVLERARAMLDQPPIPRGVSGARIAGANHASALAAMLNLAQPQDAARITRALDQATDSNLRENALQAAMTVADRSTTVDAKLVEAVARAVDDPGWPSWDREQALRALYLTAPAEAVARARKLLRASDLKIRVRAAWVMAEDDLEGNRQLLTKLIAGWPEDAPYPAFEVRQMLEENAEF
jgi:hypothetical protein